MPELPDLAIYLECLGRRVLGHPLERIRIANPFVLRTVDPPLREADGARVTALRRVGKRIVVSLEGDLHLVIHLMIAGRLHWSAGFADSRPPGPARRSTSPPGRSS